MIFAVAVATLAATLVVARPLRRLPPSLHLPAWRIP